MSPPAPGRAATSALLYDQEPGRYWLYAWEDVDIMLWKEPVDAKAVARIQRRLAKRVETSAGKVSVIHVIYPGCGLPDAEARAALSKLGSHFGSIICCIVLVVEGDGFFTSAWRALLSGLLAMARTRRRTTVAASIQAAAKWLPAHHMRTAGTALDTEQLVKILESVRSAHA